jgi:uncharacterized protein YdaU (DUF1376 family)
VNYYEHHLGDYAEATAHLSFVEDAAYTRLIRKYYASEKPIPADISAAQRLVGARSKEERAAVETVLHEFFVLRDDGWHQDRCDAEIARFRAGEPEREVKKANEHNRLKRHREERSALFKTITDAGLHAAWNTPITELRTLAATVTGSMRQPFPATAPATPATATQTPDTRHQTPEEKRTPRAARTASPKKSAIPDDFTISARVAEWAASNGHGQLTRHLEHFRSACKAKGYTYADWDEAFMGAIRKDWAGLSVPQARASPAAAKASARSEFMAEFTGRKPPNPPQSEVIDVEFRTASPRLA